MNRLLMVLALALTTPMVASCTTLALPPAPVDLADQIVMDEKAGLAVEVAYTAAALAGKYMILSGVLDRTRTDQIAAIDRQAYALVLKSRAAYDLGNATDYQAFSKQGLALVADMLKLLKGT